MYLLFSLSVVVGGLVQLPFWALVSDDLSLRHRFTASLS